MFESDLTILLRILVVVILAGIVGWERESVGKAAGLRTHMLVGVGAVMFVVLGELFVEKYQHVNDNLRYDPLRIIEAVVTGISFLGAGTIFVARGRRAQVTGLTTAASILTTAGIGMIVGLGRYVLAVGITVIIFIILHSMNYFDIKKTDKAETADGENAR